MQREFKVGQLVSLIDGFPFEGKVFKIVADKDNPWKRASPYSFEFIQVQSEKDFILLVKQGSGEFSSQSLGDTGLHVTKDKIRHYE